MSATAREVRLEQLLGRVVRTAAGRPVGRIEDVRARPDGEDYVVYLVVIGELGFLPKLLRVAAQLRMFRALGFARRFRTRAVPWHWLDLSDPERPRFVGPEKEGGKRGTGGKGGTSGKGGRAGTSDGEEQGEKEDLRAW